MKLRSFKIEIEDLTRAILKFQGTRGDNRVQETTRQNKM